MAAGDTAAAEAVRMAKAQGSEAFAFAGDQPCNSTVGSTPTNVMHSCTYVAPYGANTNLVTLLTIVSCWRRCC